MALLRQKYINPLRKVSEDEERQQQNSFCE